MRVVTMVKGKVPSSRQKEFEDAYRSAKGDNLPPGLEMSFLLRSTNEEDVIIIETVWSSKEALDTMRSSGKPRAVMLFEQAGVSPSIEIHEVAESIP